ncbi:NAD-dependent epimerase/dehydratase family protein, partial [Salmonella enterica subsp. enterica]
MQNNQGEASHIAVTGANGFIGRQLCTHLSEQQHQVRAIVRAKGTQPLKITQVVQDLAALAPD